MKKNKFWNGISMFLGIMIGLGMLVMLGRLYFGYLYYGEKKNSQDKTLESQWEDNKAGTNNNQSDSKELLENEQMGESKSERPLMTRMDTQQQIRVCLRTGDYEAAVHEFVEISGEGSYNVSWVCKNSQTEVSFGQEEKMLQNGEVLTCTAEEILYVEAEQMSPGDVLKVEVKRTAALCVNSIQRAQGIPEYSGILYLCGTKDGILLINELPLETYLYSVVASEMPSSYPAEAQKAQSVCARTYAVNCIKNRNTDEETEQILLGWAESEDKDIRQLYDLDDSVEFQVYNNQKETAESRKAVQETAGEILNREEILYYSTSPGTGRRMDLGDEAVFAEFLEEEPEENAEYGSPWLRWEVQLKESDVLKHLKKYQGMEFEKIKSLNIVERNGKGQIQKLEITGKEYSAIIEGEYWIRKVLSPENAGICLRNGTVVEGMSMLPSAFFVVEMNEDDDNILTISGGGYGHGIGMSQYGAAAMAQSGSDYREILEYYYGGTVL